MSWNEEQTRQFGAALRAAVDSIRPQLEHAGMGVQLDLAAHQARLGAREALRTPFERLYQAVGQRLEGELERELERATDALIGAAVAEVGRALFQTAPRPERLPIVPGADGLPRASREGWAQGA